MVKTKGAAAASSKWNKAIPGVGTSYKEGIDRSSGWKEAALKGEELYKEAVTKAANEGRRAQGIEAVSEQKWKEGASTKGAERITRGMEASKTEYASKIAKVINVIEGVELPERTTDPATNVANRVVPLAVRLNEAKKSGELK